VKGSLVQQAAPGGSLASFQATVVKVVESTYGSAAKGITVGNQAYTSLSLEGYPLLPSNGKGVGVEVNNVTYSADSPESEPVELFPIRPQRRLVLQRPAEPID